MYFHVFQNNKREKIDQILGQTSYLQTQKNILCDSNLHLCLEQAQHVEFSRNIRPIS